MLLLKIMILMFGRILNPMLPWIGKAGKVNLKRVIKIFLALGLEVTAGQPVRIGKMSEIQQTLLLIEITLGIEIILITGLHPGITMIGILEMTLDTDQTIILDTDQTIILDLTLTILQGTGLTITLKTALITPDNVTILGVGMTILDARLIPVTSDHLDTILGKILDILMIGLGLIAKIGQVHLTIDQLTQVEHALHPPSDGIPIVIRIPNILQIEHRVGTDSIMSLGKISFPT